VRQGPSILLAMSDPTDLCIEPKVAKAYGFGSWLAVTIRRRSAGAAGSRPLLKKLIRGSGAKRRENPASGHF
jgi:hypothetical protein